MAAKRKIELFDEIKSEREFEHVLRNNKNTLICKSMNKVIQIVNGAEIFSYFAGHCTALDRLFNTAKLDWSNGKMILLRVPADDIEVLERFRDQSEPVYMFILRKKVTKVFRGVNNLKLAEVVKKELVIWMKECEGATLDRPLYELNEPTPDEMDWISKRAEEKRQESTVRAATNSRRQAARKRHRAELMVPHLQTLNFVLFWPHCLQAHPDLYERWDANNIIMVGREVIQLDEELARDVLYAGDAPLNEASLQKLLDGQALAICFRLLDSDTNFVSLVRKILYEDLPEYDESKPADQQSPRVTAFDHYKTLSPTRHQVWQKRKEDRVRRRDEELKQRARRLSEIQRLARQAIEEAKEAKKREKENRKMELLKTGNLQALKKLDEEPDTEHFNIEIPEELPDEMVEEASSEEDENEYLPPPGLVIPGFYAPPNDVAKANGLAVLFPKIVADYVIPEPEYLPPHVLAMLEISKRYKAIEAMTKHKKAIIHMGIFKATTLNQPEHLAYSVMQFDTLNISENLEQLTLAFMVSVKTDIPLLQLMDLNPIHVSRDPVTGEDECANMFPLDYGDEYDEFEDFQ